MISKLKALLDELRPIRRDQQNRIERALEQVIREDREHALETLQTFLAVMEQAKTIHAQIDAVLVEEPFVKRWAVYRPAFSGGENPERCERVICAARGFRSEQEAQIWARSNRTWLYFEIVPVWMREDKDQEMVL